MNVEGVFSDVTVPAGLTVGDTFPLAGTARIIAIEEGLVDVTNFAVRSQGVWPGDRSYRILFIAGAPS